MLNSGRNVLLETLSAASNSAALSSARLMAFKWIDIRELDNKYSRWTMIDDSENQGEIWSSERVSMILSNYSDRIIPWSQRATILKSQ